MMIYDDVESTKSRLLVAQLCGGVVNMGVAVPLDACILNLHLDGRYIHKPTLTQLAHGMFLYDCKAVNFPILCSSSCLFHDSPSLFLVHTITVCHHT